MDSKDTSKQPDLKMDPDINKDSLGEEISLTSSSSSTHLSTSLSRTESTTDSQKELIGEDNTDHSNKEETTPPNKETPSLSKNTKQDQRPTHSSKKSKASSTDENQKTSGSSNSVKSKLKNPLAMFRKKSEKAKEREERQAKFERMLQAVSVDALPQVFVTKYIGYKPTKGLYGVQYTREAVENLISELGSADAQKHLPLTQLHVSIRGIHVTEHKDNTSARALPDTGLVPIEFISYGVQDMRYTKVFTCILVRELSSRSRSLECHAYLCDSSTTCRKLALSMALAFKEYSRTIKDKPHKFEVDLSTQGMIEHGEFVVEGDADDKEKVLGDTEFDA